MSHKFKIYRRGKDNYYFAKKRFLYFFWVKVTRPIWVGGSSNIVYSHSPEFLVKELNELYPPKESEVLTLVSTHSID